VTALAMPSGQSEGRPAKLGRVAIFGVGLIGGSFALALKRASAVHEVVGVGRKRATMERALELGVIDRIADTPAEALQACDLVLLAAPVAQTPVILASIKPYLQDGTTVTDAGSTKGDAVAAARMALGERVGQFVPGHPIAGGELHGPDAAKANLFDDRNVILTPLPENEAGRLSLVQSAWEACGARVRAMPAPQHDTVLASVSHLPHMLAYALVAQIAEADDAALRFDFAGGGFRDFTRIAASSPEMWRDIALSNRDALLAEMDAYAAMLTRLRAMIDSGDGPAMEALFALASKKRLNWTPGG